MISYDQVKSVVSPAPNEELVGLYNEIDAMMTAHSNCINEINPFSKLYQKDHFCVSATSIQTNYIAFVLGKHHDSLFPGTLMTNLFNVESKFLMQYGEIPGRQINGCIVVFHKEPKKLDLQKIYDHIYEL